jgi:hypothetical protein
MSPDVGFVLHFHLLLPFFLYLLCAFSGPSGDSSNNKLSSAKLAPTREWSFAVRSTVQFGFSSLENFLEHILQKYALLSDRSAAGTQKRERGKKN